MVKGNSGKAARSRLLKRLLVVVVLCASIIAICESFGYGRLWKSRRNRAKPHQHRDRLEDSMGDDTIRNESRSREKGLRQRRRMMKRINYDNLTEEQKINLIVTGQVQLKDISIGNGIMSAEEHSYKDVTGHFCQINWSLHKEEPSSYPMYRDLVAKSDCVKSINFDLKEAVRLIQENDNGGDEDGHSATSSQKQSQPKSHTMQPNGFVFHESRCGSTLASNALAVMEPSQHRVYSEAMPTFKVLAKCEMNGNSCPKGTTVSLLRDVIYVMGRTNDQNEQRMFMKLQSISTKFIDLFLEAFPSTPWIFIYRNPVEVMMSQFTYGASNANCVRQFQNVPDDVKKILSNNGKTESTLSPEEKCAIHLGSLCKAGSKALSATHTGRAVNYEGLSKNLVSKVIPNHFGVPMTEDARERITIISSKYSKGRGNRKSKWKDDSERKKDRATPEIKQASELFLGSSYIQLEDFARQSNDDGVNLL